MIIGLDFDNTLVNYSGVFHNVARSLDWLPESVGQSKAEVKDYFFSIDNENQWTELQGKVYGTYIHEAKPYQGVIPFIDWAMAQGHQLFIISHKTKYPYIGDKVDFHQSALKWLKQNDFIKPERLSLEHCFFNETKEAKLEKIKALKCDFFIDDLSRILDHPLFPVECHGILFSPHDLAEQKETVLTSWLNFQDIFYDK